MLQIDHIGTRSAIPGWPQNGTIEGLLDALSRWELDPCLDFSRAPQYESHPDRQPYRRPASLGGGRKWSDELGGYRYLDGPPLYPEHPTAVSFTGNFLGYSFGFNLTTDDRELIARLDAAIAQNIERFRPQQQDGQQDVDRGMRPRQG